MFTDMETTWFGAPVTRTATDPQNVTSRVYLYMEFLRWWTQLNPCIVETMHRKALQQSLSATYQKHDSQLDKTLLGARQTLI